MSSYEDYSETSRHYDTTRIAVGVELVLGCFLLGPRPLSETVALDAGCGTGSYSEALLRHIARVEAVDLNERMLAVAAAKLDRAVAEDRVRFHRAAIDRLPLEDDSIDCITVNQVLHHLDDDPESGFPALRRVLEEFARVLRSEGVLVVNTCSHEQLRHGWWYYALVPERIEAMCRRHIPCGSLVALLDECGFAHAGRYVPLDAVIQGAAYFDALGPLQSRWRHGDSMWSTLSENELERALSTIRSLDASGALDDFIARHDARRRSVGQVTFHCALRR